MKNDNEFNPARFTPQPYTECETAYVDMENDEEGSCVTYEDYKILLDRFNALKEATA